MSMRTLAGRLEILPELVPMSPSIFETIALVIAPELYGGKPFAEPTDAAPGSIEKLEIMIQRVQNGFSAISPGDKRDRHASHYNDRGADHRCWLDTMEFGDE
jgi:hypothetical protein